jgi:hypothetical protein
MQLTMTELVTDIAAEDRNGLPMLFPWKATFYRSPQFLGSNRPEVDYSFPASA